MTKKNQRTPFSYKYYRHAGEPSVSKAKTVKKPKSHKGVWLASLLIVCAGVVWLSVHPFNKKEKTSPPVLVTTRAATKTTPSPAQNLPLGNISVMNNAVNAVIQANPQVTFEVAITDINTGAQQNYGVTGPMTAASVNKVITATDYLNEVENGSETMNEILEDGNSASTDLKSMIVVSNDTAWDALRDELTYPQEQTYANSLGLNSFDPYSNVLSARDAANLFTAVYEGKLLNNSNTQLLLSYLEEANYTNYILPAVPSSDTVYHKVGFYTDNVNDVAIITNAKQAIVLSIFTNGNGTYDWTDRATMMQEIARPVLAYYMLS